MAVKTVSERLMPAAMMASYLKDLPDDALGIREWVQRHAMQVENELDQMAGMMHGSEQLRPLGAPEPRQPQPQDQGGAPPDQGTPPPDQSQPGNQLTQ
jgi:hypothetical protein